MPKTAVKRFEENMKRSGKELYAMLHRGEITPNDMLWCQAFGAYRCLCIFSEKNSLMARNIRLYLFTEKLHGVVEKAENGERRFRLPDGSVYTSLLEEALLKQMICYIRNSFQECSVLEDVGVAKRIPQTPSALRAFLMEETNDRNCLLRFLFALRLPAEEYNAVLENVVFSEPLNESVPKELIILYCLRNRDYNWEHVNELQSAAEKYMRECSMEEVEARWPWGALFSDEFINKYVKRPMGGMLKNDFIENCLIPCCDQVLLKSPNMTNRGTKLRYSKSRLNIMLKESILRDAEYTNQMYSANTYAGCYRASIMKEFKDKLSVPDDYPLISDSLGRDKVMSRENYCRLFSYRIAAVDKGNRHGIWRLKYGRLPIQLKKSILMYSDIEHLPGRDDKEAIKNSSAHNIKRYMVMLAVFMHLLLKKWQNADYLAHSQEEADRLWEIFFKDIRTNLADARFSSFTRANPLDAMLCLCLHAINPLECYNRIYELDMLESFAEDHEPDHSKHYPPPEQIRRVLRELRECSGKLKGFHMHDDEACEAFCCKVEKKLALQE